MKISGCFSFYIPALYFCVFGGNAGSGNRAESAFPSGLHRYSQDNRCNSFCRRPSDSAPAPFSYYLSAESIRQSALSFDIPFDRQQLADFLCVERAAMSAELSKL